MKIKVLDLRELRHDRQVEAALQAAYDEGYDLIEVAGGYRHLLIMAKARPVR